MSCLSKQDFETEKPRLVYNDDQLEGSIALVICLALGLVIIVLAFSMGG